MIALNVEDTATGIMVIYRRLEAKLCYIIFYKISIYSEVLWYFTLKFCFFLKKLDLLFSC